MRRATGLSLYMGCFACGDWLDFSIDVWQHCRNDPAHAALHTTYQVGSLGLGRSRTRYLRSASSQPTGDGTDLTGQTGQAWTGAGLAGQEQGQGQHDCLSPMGRVGEGLTLT